MLKPLTKEQADRILSIAAEEFADRGFAGTAIGSIAKKAGVSVGVIYKYYSGKEDLFNACVRRSLGSMEEVLGITGSEGGSLMEMLENLISRMQKFARENPEYIRLYHQITVSGSPAGKTQSAELIESGTAKIYSDFIKRAAESGEIRDDIDPAAFAFLIDDLLMMLHFSYACDYYIDRFRIYFGEDALDKDEAVREQMLKFIGAALGVQNR
ncbi:MAG: TetR/AcrR family transcriptional regulator [Mogibacterium sp.]|nr:TetR/AcrR family transcriptional regulator [Mogibacterium sp.]